MEKLKLENNKQALVIVAHPDDETIWMGGTILCYPAVRWTIFSLCRAADPDRAPKFRKICRLYGAKALISDLDDEAKLTLNQSLPEIKKKLNKFVSKNKYEYIFTHGRNGEYGHPRHIGLSQVIEKMIKEKRLICQKIFYFAYKKRGANIANNTILANCYLDLSKAELRRKKEIITDYYGFSKNSFEAKSSKKRETFWLINN